MKKNLKNTSSKLQQIQYKILPIFKEKGVLRGAIFGSFALGEERHDSDIDILIDLPKDKTLLDLVDLQLTLENILNRKVDVITYNSLSPVLKDSILREQIPIYEKRS